MADQVFHVDDGVYDRFMGRYSARLAPLFADFAGVHPGARVLDVGAGTGALAAALIDRVGAANVAAAEPSPEFTDGLEQRFPGVEVRLASAEQMPWPDASFDVVLAQLVVSFVADPGAAAAEMARLARPGGVVAVCMWHEQGLELAPPLHAARQASMPPDTVPLPQLPLRSEVALAALLADAGLHEVETGMLEVVSEYASFDEFWSGARAMVGPDTAWMHQTDEAGLAKARDVAYETLGSPAGRFTLAGRAAAARAVTSRGGRRSR
jgi:SAM-dependent methyltransferase